MLSDRSGRVILLATAALCMWNVAAGFFVSIASINSTSAGH